MKRTLFAVMVGLLSTVAFAQQDWRPVLVNHLPEDTFTPQGFDSNDNTQVVLAGTFPNTCYKVGPASYKVDEETKKVTIKNQAYFYNSSWCAFVLVPYTQVVSVGILGTGNYEVMVEDESGTGKPMASMPISKTNNLDPDDYLYAPVTEAIVNEKENTGRHVLTLRGSFTNTCMSLKDVKVNYRKNRVIEVLPIADMKSGGCADVMVPFSKTLDLDREITGRHLIHVRALNGAAVNNVFEFTKHN